MHSDLHAEGATRSCLTNSRRKVDRGRSPPSRRVGDLREEANVQPRRDVPLCGRRPVPVRHRGSGHTHPDEQHLQHPNSMPVMT